MNIQFWMVFERASFKDDVRACSKLSNIVLYFTAGVRLGLFAVVGGGRSAAFDSHSIADL